jgi:hypothetical protein
MLNRILVMLRVQPNKEQLCFVLQFENLLSYQIFFWKHAFVVEPRSNAVTSLLSGIFFLPHGIVGPGNHDRDLCSNALALPGPFKVTV